MVDEGTDTDTTYTTINNVVAETAGEIFDKLCNQQKRLVTPEEK